MQRTGGTQRTPWIVAMIAVASAAAIGCGDDGDSVNDGDGSIIDSRTDSPDDPPIDAPPIDGPVDAPVDAAGCGTDIRLVGQYLDWDSTNAGFIGIGGSNWTVVGDLARSTITPPNGQLLLCLSPAATSQINISGPAGYIPGRFVADPAVFSPAGSRFEARGLQSAMAVTQFMELPQQPYNSSFAQILVYKIGAPIPLALEPVINPPQRSFVSDGPNDITWTAGDTGTFTLFANRPPVGGTATLTSTSMFTGPTTIPLISGAFTIVVIR